jgi:hypothetical protein
MARENKQILRLRLRMTFKDRHVEGPHFSKEHTKISESILLNFALFVSLVVN